MSKLLIIDDEVNVLYSLRTGLEAEDLTITTARTAKQGIAAADLLSIPWTREGDDA